MLTESAQRHCLARIERALTAASAVADRFEPGTLDVRDEGGRNVVTEVDRRTRQALRAELLASGGNGCQKGTQTTARGLPATPCGS
jgi:hypothetical protein